MKLQDLVTEADAALSKEEQAADFAFAQSRKIIRKTKTAIHGIHVGKRDPELIDGISSDLAGLTEALTDYPRLLYGNDVENAMMEFAETVLYDYSVRDLELPSYSDLDVTPGTWLLGLADCIGELRRDMLTRLMNGELGAAVKIFGKMEELADVLMTFDIKESVVPIRRKQDIARGIMDRSRTDIATAKIMKNRF